MIIKVLITYAIIASGCVSWGDSEEYTVPRENGRECEIDSDCQGFCMHYSEDGSLEFPGGFCSSACAPDGTRCASGSVCVEDISSGGNLCLPTCEYFIDCRVDEGYSCEPLNFLSLKVCLPPSREEPSL